MNDHPTHSESGVAEMPPPARHSEYRGKGRALVVDDEDAVRIVVTSAVTRLGFTVDSASDGPTAIALFQLDPASYAIVLLDVRLPRMSGPQTMRRLRDMRPDIPVILMSGYSAEEIEENCQGQGPSGFLNKPFTLDSLTTKIMAVLPAGSVSSRKE